MPGTTLGLIPLKAFESGGITPGLTPPLTPPRRYLPVESAMPGTTLGLIPLKAFESGGTLFGAPRTAARSPAPCQRAGRVF